MNGFAPCQCFDAWRPRLCSRLAVTAVSGHPVSRRRDGKWAGNRPCDLPRIIHHFASPWPAGAKQRHGTVCLPCLIAAGIMRPKDLHVCVIPWGLAPPDLHDPLFVPCSHFGPSHFNAQDSATNRHQPLGASTPCGPMADPKWIIGWCHDANLPWRAASNDYKILLEWACSIGDGNDITGPVWACWLDGSGDQIPWILGPFFEKRILPQKLRVGWVIRQLKDKGKRRVFSEKTRKPLPKSRPAPSSRCFDALRPDRAKVRSCDTLRSG